MGHNKIKILEVPKNLEVLNCCYNSLSVLDRLPSSLRILKCANNNISDLSYIPQDLVLLYCLNNPMLYFTLKEWLLVKQSNWYNYGLGS